ncbi:MAG: response regulator [Candidatus Marinimicrobia bacterium]|nr:response regulator [Candidatus Neomarinimicrobiota bacterium]MCF7827363.1 response regulator [Candidatus Neomarinimicrobiota bacterium]MCF7881404.1 response regulator [Candidatus Neomarinimicrobiota bacterium]
MGLQVLIVDDNKNICTLLEDILSLDNHTSAVANDGKAAKAALENGKYDVVFCDLTLPDISGWDIVQHIKDNTPETEVVIISGMGDSIDQEKLSEHNIDNVIHKPFQITDVQSVLADLQ